MNMAERAYGTLGIDRVQDVVGRWMAPRRRSFFSQWDNWLALGLLAVPAAVAVAYRVKGTRPGAAQGNRRIRDVMIDRVMTVDVNASLREAAQLMLDGNVGALPVMEQGEVRGIVTDRDVVVRGVARHSDVGGVRVGEVATKILVSARPEWTVDEAMRVMSEHQIGRLPVVDDRQQVVGMVTLSSLALRADEGEEALATAQNVSRRSARGALRKIA